MRRTRPFIGLSVVDETTGHVLGKVQDLLFLNDQEVYGLLLKPPSWFSQGKVLAFTGILTVGTDAIMVHAKATWEEVKTLEPYRCMIEGKHPFDGKCLYTEKGNLCGEVADVYIDQKSGKIIGYEISDGLLADLLSGRKYISKDEVLEISENLVVKSEPVKIPDAIHIS